MSDTVKAGDRIIYAAQDSGRQFDAMGLILIPDEILTVGGDVDVEFAGRLVEDHVCRVAEAAPDDTAPAVAVTGAAGKGDEGKGDEGQATEQTAPPVLRDAPPSRAPAPESPAPESPAPTPETPTPGAGAAAQD